MQNSASVTVESIRNIRVHPNADKLLLAQVLGYQVIIPKDTFAENQLVLFVKPDSVLPKDQDWAKPYLQYVHTRVKAVKLRQEWSEGLTIPIEGILIKDGASIITIFEGMDCSEFLGVSHYEPPIVQDLQAKGSLPFEIPKTDEERWENLKEYEIPFDEECDVSLKVDGQSWSMYCKLNDSFEDHEFGILGRSMEYKLDCRNNYTRFVIDNPDIKRVFIDFCKKYNKSICLRGESHGGGIQKMEINPHCKLPHSIAFYSVYLIDERRYANKDDMFYFINVIDELNDMLAVDIERLQTDIRFNTVKILEENVKITKDLIKKYSVDLEKIDGQNFEGVVIKHSKGSFKIINKNYDSKK